MLRGSFFSIAAALGLSAGAARLAASPLSPDARVAAQARIERIYHAHRLWPRENPGPKPSFENAVPGAVVAARAGDGPAKSAVLESRYGVHLGPAALQAELERMAKHSRAPAMLAELFAALDHDPRLEAEVLARPLLADRLLRGQYARDAAQHAYARRAAEALREQARAGTLAGAPTGEFSRLRYRPQAAAAPAVPGAAADEFTALPPAAYRELLQRTAGAAEPGPVEETDDAFLVRRTAHADASEIEIEIVRVEKIPFEAWWQNTAPTAAADPPDEESASGFREPPLPQSGPCDGWSGVRNNAADPRQGHTAVWTGSEMIVWGGYAFTTQGNYLNSGGRYNPATDSWQPVAIDGNTPAGRTGHAAVWSGTEMIVFGGYSYSTQDIYYTGGGRYNPASDSWAFVSTAGAPAGRTLATAVWSGTEMIAWGGIAGGTFFNTGGRYNPSTNSWTATSTGANAPSGRYLHGAAWAGSVLVVWGGYNTGGNLGDGARYTPGTDSWSAITAANAPSARRAHSAVAAGSLFVVWGGTGNTGALNSGGRYDPVADSWSAVTLTGAPAARSKHTAVWSGSEMIVWGGLAGGYLNSGGRYNPLTDAWSATGAGALLPAARYGHSAVWTGTQMIVWGGYDGANYLSSGGRYAAASDGWLATSVESSAPTARSGHTAVWTGSEMIVWGGGNGLATGSRYNPATDSWAPTPATGAPAGRSSHSALWSGSEMIVWGGIGAGSCCANLSAGGRYNPATDGWSATTTTGAPSARYNHSAVWTGTQMIVYGGQYNVVSIYGDGARYTPSSNTWTALSGTGAPAARSQHAAVWSGTEMIVWGGYNYTSTSVYYADGARYNAAANSWIALPAVSLSGRSGAGAAWSGSEMIVWGGYAFAGVNTWYGDGARFNPASNTWTPVSATGAPAARSAPATTVWSGSDLIVWGGSSGGYLNSGGRYRPATDDWLTAATAGAPSARSGVAVWAGSAMIEWGGTNGSSSLATGGVYALNAPAAPGGVTAAAAGANQINVVWNAVSGATEYHLYRSFSAAGPFAQIAVITAPAVNYTDTGVSGAVPYYYFVRAHNGCESFDSAHVSATTTGACTVAPAFTGLGSAASAGIGSCSARLGWSAATPHCGGPATYTIYRSTTSGFTPAAGNRIASGVSGTTCGDFAGLANGTPYYYIVRSVDAANGAEDTNTVQQAMTAAGALTGLSASFSESFGAGDPPAGWTLANGAGTQHWTTANPGNLAVPAGMSVPMESVNGSLNTGGSMNESLVSPAFSGTGAALVNLAFNTYYHASSNSNAYVELTTNGGASWSPVATYSGNIDFGSAATAASPVYDLSAAAAGAASAQLRFRYSATYANDWRLDNVQVTTAAQSACTTCGVTPPGPPASPAAAATTNHSVDLSWSAGAPAGTSYAVYRAAGSCATAGKFARIASGLSATAYTDAGAQGGLTYAYVITASGSGCESLPSTCVQAAPCVTAPNFSGLNAVTNGAQNNCTMSLGWSAAGNQCGGGVMTYDLYRSTTPNFTPAAGNRIATGLIGSSYSDYASLVSGTPYFYLARAVDPLGNRDTNTAYGLGTATGAYGPGTGSYAETFEGALSGGGFDNAGWLHYNNSGAGDWAWSAAQAQTPTHSWTAASQTTASDRVLVSPEFSATSASSLTFYHTYAFDACYDGGDLEYQTPGGNSWYPVSSFYFTAGAYTGAITYHNADFSNPLLYASAWCNGTVGAMTPVTVNLGSMVGNNRVRLRWREADNNSTAGPGWFVDSLAVSNVHPGSACVSCTAPPPGSPTSPVATVTGATTASLSWGAGTPAGTSYNIYRSSTNCSSNLTKVGGTAAFNFSDTGLIPGTAYYYRITSAGSDGCESAQSSCVSATPCGTPPTFSGVTSVSNPQSATCLMSLSWTGGYNNCGGGYPTYNVYRGSTPGFTPAAGNRVASGITGAGYTDGSSLSPGAAYYYKVRAQDSYGNEDANTVVRAGIPTGAPGASTQSFSESFEGAQSGGGFDNGGWTHYADSGAGDWAWSAAQAQSPTHAWFSASQATASARALVSPPLALTSSSVISFYHTYSFDACNDGGLLQYSNDGGNYWYGVYSGIFTAGAFDGTVAYGDYSNPYYGQPAWCGGSIGAMTQSSLNFGGYYGAGTYLLRWIEGDNSSVAGTGWYVDSVAVSNVAVAAACTTCGGVVPGAPVSVTVTATGPTRMVVSWSGGTPAGGTYNVYRSTNYNGPYSKIASGLTTTSYTDTAAIAGSYNYYTVSASGGAGCESQQSPYAYAYPCNAPTFAGLSSATGAVQASCADALSWAAGTPSCTLNVSYNIYRSTASGFTPSAANRIFAGYAGTSYTDTNNLAYGTPYYYVVRAVDDFGNEETNTVQQSATPAGGLSAVYTETFEGAGGFDNAGWTHGITAGTLDWSLSTAQSQTPAHSWFVGCASGDDNYLQSGAIALPAGAPVLSFWHTYHFENNYDGGRLEISTNGGTSWSAVPAAAFSAGGYTGTISSMGGAQGWTGGAIGAMSNVSVNLGAWAGQSVKLRWHDTQDGSVNFEGWYVDSVTLGTPTACSSCAITPMTAVRQSKSGTDLVQSWTVIGGAGGYAPFRSPLPNPVSWGAPQATLAGSATGWTDTGALGAATSAFYTVTDTNACGAVSPQ